MSNYVRETLKKLASLISLGLVLTLAPLAGCDKKEKVLDVDTPEGGVEIHKSEEGLEIDVKKRDKKTKDSESDVDANDSKDSSGK